MHQRTNQLRILQQPPLRQPFQLLQQKQRRQGLWETSRSRRRGRRAATDHNTEPVSTTSTLAPDTEATPTMDDPNGATVSSQDVPDPTFKKKDGDVYTYHILNLTKFNERYNVNYYTRTYKNFDSSTNSVVELVDKILEMSLKLLMYLQIAVLNSSQRQPWLLMVS